MLIRLNIYLNTTHSLIRQKVKLLEQMNTMRSSLVKLKKATPLEYNWPTREQSRMILCKLYFGLDTRNTLFVKYYYITILIVLLQYRIFISVAYYYNIHYSC